MTQRSLQFVTLQQQLRPGVEYGAAPGVIVVTARIALSLSTFFDSKRKIFARHPVPNHGETPAHKLERCHAERERERGQNARWNRHFLGSAPGLDTFLSPSLPRRKKTAVLSSASNLFCRRKAAWKSPPHLSNKNPAIAARAHSRQDQCSS
jgi:hypothetical protein